MRRSDNQEGVLVALAEIVCLCRKSTSKKRVFEMDERIEYENHDSMAKESGRTDGFVRVSTA